MEGSRLYVRLLILACALAALVSPAHGQAAKIVLPGGEEVLGIASTSSAITLSASISYELHFPASSVEQFGCSPITALPATITPKLLILRRSQCSFEEKVLQAQAAGASLVVIMNTEEQVQNTSSGLLLNPCTVDCSLGSSQSSATECAASTLCRSNYCLPNAVDPSQVATQKFCCVENDPLLNMAYANNTITIGGVHVGTTGGNTLIAAAVTNELVTVQQFTPGFSGFPTSAVALLFIGTLVTIFASFRAVRKERKEVCSYWGQTIGDADKGNATSSEGASRAPEENKPTERAAKKQPEVVPEDPDGMFDQVELTLGIGLCFLLVSTASLVGFYFLFKLYPTEGVIAIIALYAIGSIFATSYFFVQPLLALILPKRFTGHQFGLGPTAQACLESETLSVKSILGTTIAMVLAIVWFVFRHSDWAWVLQNIFSAALACIFLLTVRMSSLKIATIILFGFFVYDIFMVFITPSFGNGESIMVEVATAGAGDVTVSSSGLTCDREPDERLPMLFLFPREGGFGLLGLGDIIIPGIFVVYALRADYIKLQLSGFEPLSPFTWSGSICRFIKTHAYFLTVSLFYFIGLLGAFLANLFGLTVNGVQGQPALLYIVPAVILSFQALSVARGDFCLFWSNSLETIAEGSDTEESAPVPSS